MLGLTLNVWPFMSGLLPCDLRELLIKSTTLQPVFLPICSPSSIIYTIRRHYVAAEAILKSWSQEMSSAKEADVSKLGNPDWPKANHQARTELCV